MELGDVNWFHVIEFKRLYQDVVLLEDELWIFVDIFGVKHCIVVIWVDALSFKFVKDVASMAF